MANVETLEKVYSVIGMLRAKGLSRLDVDLVARTAGVARSTFYLKDADWEEVRAVIKGKHSDRVKLVEVDVSQKSAASRELDRLTERLEEAEKEVADVRSTAEKVYRELIDEVQRWFVKASEMPAKQAQTARYIEELNSTRRELERLRADHRVLKAEVEEKRAVRPFVVKKTVHLDSFQPPGELFTNFLAQWEPLVPRPGSSQGIAAAYVLCGLPSSGKTEWIEQHKPSLTGVHIYVDSCAHSTDVRNFIAKRIRATTKAEIYCVWLRKGQSGVTDQVVSANDVGATAFEPPSLREPFDTFVLSPKEQS